MSAAPFFELSASYTIAPSASLADLINDCECLLHSGIGGVEAEDLSGFTSAQWAGMYVLRQAAAVFAEIAKRARAGERVGGATPC